MTPTAFNRTISPYSTSSAEWALVLGCTPRAFNKWRAGQNQPSGPVVAFFRLLEMLPARKRQAAIADMLSNARGEQ